jgi:molybdopterin synthase catalytic subunit
VIPVRIAVTPEPLDIAAETAAFAAGDAGAMVSFTGVCRSESGRLAALELEHYPGMAEAEIGRIVEEANIRWPLQRVLVIHRYGRIVPGEPIVLVATASEHRQAAFQAAEFLMDFMKTKAPFWKREHLADGSIGPWVEAHARDDDAMGRWVR